MPVIKSAVRSALSDSVREAVASPWRYFPTFDPVLNSYCELDAAFTPSGGYELEKDVYVSALASNENALSLGVFLVRIVSPTSISVWTNTANSPASFTVADISNTLTTVRVKGDNSSADIELFINGVSQGTQTAGATPGFTVGPYKNIGQWNNNFFDGIIANVKLTDIATAANSRIFPLALGPGSSVENSTINSGSVTYTNISDGNRKLYTFDEANNQWVGEGGSPILQVA